MNPRKIILELGKALALLASLGLVLLAPGEQVTAAPQALTFQVSNPVCVQPDPDHGACQILVRSISASDPSLLSVDISVNSKLRARFQTFFESGITFNYRMLSGGIQVACGGPGSGGDPNYGRLYQVQIQATVQGSGPSLDSASVFCPSYNGKVYLPKVSR